MYEIRLLEKQKLWKDKKKCTACPWKYLGNAGRSITGGYLPIWTEVLVTSQNILHLWEENVHKE